MSRQSRLSNPMAHGLYAYSLPLFVDVAYHTSDCMMITGVDGTIEFVNPAFERISGYSLNEVKGANPRIMQSGEQTTAFYQRMWRTLKQGKVFRDTFINRRKDGTWYFLDQTITPIFNGIGTVTHYVSLARDIIAQVQAEAALKESEERFRILFEQSPIGIGLFDQQGRILEVNQATLKILGIPSVDHIKNQNLFIDGNINPENQRLLNNGKPIREEREIDLLDLGKRFQFVQKIKKKRAVDIIICPVFKNRSLQGYMAQVQDITQRRDQDTMRQAITAEIIRASEREKNFLAQELHDSVCQSLASLKLFLELERKRHAPNRILNTKWTYAINSLAEMINQTREVVNGLHPQTLETLGLESTIQSTIESMTEHLRISSDINIQPFAHLIPKEMHIEILRIIQESVHNVIKHAQANRLTVCIQSREKEIWIRIQDNGVGFEPDHSLALSGNAPHLGLRIMQERVALLGAQMKVGSQPGRGTTVTIIIPMPLAPTQMELANPYYD